MSVLDEVFGNILDVDSHEWTPAYLWEEEFGPASQVLAAMLEVMPDKGHAGWYLRREPDDAEITPESIWQLKGPYAPSSFDLRRRPAVLDIMGIDRQLIFAGGPGLFGLMLATCPVERIIKKLLHDVGEAADLLPDMGDFDSHALGRDLLRGHNDWAIRVAAMNPRLRPVAILDTTAVEGAIAEAERVVDAGVRAFLIASDCPPGGLSPADEKLDPFWRTFTDADVPVMLHITGEFNFMASMAWSAVPQFSSPKTLTEINLDPYTLATVHLGAQNFVTTMVLGGVFERHPTLRFGAIELGAQWIGPLAESLDIWADQCAKRLSYLSLSPSEYLQRNVRVSAFHWEVVDRYIDRYGLEDVYAFATDFPHFEGGVDPETKFAACMERSGAAAAQKFFVTNGGLLFP